ncbi:MAG: class III signal peptide-containing protein [Methanobacterium sp.]
MDNKGQISAEYLLLIVVMLTILSYSITNLIGPSIDASNDISWTSDAKIAVETVANAVNIVYANGPGSKRTFDVYIPKDNMKLQSSGDDIYIITNLTDGTSKNVSASTGYNLKSNSITLSKNWHTIQVQWPIGTNAINITALT